MSADGVRHDSRSPSTALRTGRWREIGLPTRFFIRREAADIAVRNYVRLASCRCLERVHTGTRAAARACEAVQAGAGLHRRPAIVCDVVDAAER